MNIESLIMDAGPLGPLIVFILLLMSGVGIPIGEDVVNIPAGFLIAQGSMNPWWTLAAAYFGILIADFTWFTLCSRYGAWILHRRWIKRLIHPKRILQAKHQIERRGIWFIAIARFVPSSRTSAITVAGMLHMKFWEFAIVEAICVAIAAPMQLGFGYLIGVGVGTRDSAETIQWLVGIVLVVALAPVAIGWLIRLRSRRSGEPKRAKAKWLRRFRHPRRKSATAS